MIKNINSKPWTQDGLSLVFRWSKFSSLNADIVLADIYNVVYSLYLKLYGLG